MVKRFILSFYALFCTHFLISLRRNSYAHLLLIRHGVFWLSSDIMLQCIGGFFASLVRCCDLDLYKQSRGLDDPELLARETVCMFLIFYSFNCGLYIYEMHSIHIVASTWCPANPKLKLDVGDQNELGYQNEVWYNLGHLLSFQKQKL